MCWIGLKEQKRIATEPVVMYKLLNHNLYSLWYPHKYRLGYEECTTIRRDIYSEIPNTYDIVELGEGIHGLSKNCVVDKHPFDSTFISFAKAVGCPFRWKRFILVKGIIPKGSIYYINENGAMITEKWIPIEIVPFTELTYYVQGVV